MSKTNTTRRPRKLPAGVEAVTRKRRDGRPYEVFRVRYRDAAGERRSKTFDSVQDAADWRSKVRLAERSGDLADLDAGTETLDTFAQEWVDRWAGGNLAETTVRGYISSYNRHISPRLGSMPLRTITPAVVEDFTRELERAGVGARRAARRSCSCRGCSGAPSCGSACAPTPSPRSASRAAVASRRSSR